MKSLFTVLCIVGFFLFVQPFSSLALGRGQVEILVGAAKAFGIVMGNSSSSNLSSLIENIDCTKTLCSEKSLCELINLGSLANNSYCQNYSDFPIDPDEYVWNRYIDILPRFDSCNKADIAKSQEITNSLIFPPAGTLVIEDIEGSRFPEFSQSTKELVKQCSEEQNNRDEYLRLNKADLLAIIKGEPVINNNNNLDSNDLPLKNNSSPVPTLYYLLN
ncbi:hypothetical protein Xen7305DRAFT_00021320 [Xenococcus sp. PCC 7305]|nr:hypothetical protein Xen7305DRAFT_00021320 [Xenococcus sp. PCC 7305]